MFPVLLSLFVVLLLTGCSSPARVYGVYAHDTRVLLRLDYDYNADGVIDVRTYMRNGAPVRLEGDANGDGRIDRWEYYSSAGELLRVGGSTQGDGREDTWARVVDGDTHVDLSTRRDNIVDRREVYRGGVLVRAESDTNYDGLPDTWEEFEQGVLARLLLDDDKRHGRPTRRIVYAPGRGPVRVDIIKEEDHASR